MTNSEYSSNNNSSKNCITKRMLFIATDDPKTINEANEKWGSRYKIYHGNLDTQSNIIFGLSVNDKFLFMLLNLQNKI